MVTGWARVISGQDELLGFQRGEVLVCDALSPTMTFVIPLASAVVERRGGMLIHGAIIAREYGIPCVTGIPYALCGGLAMAAHGWPRATMDIDLLIEEARLEEVKAVARSLGFEHEAGFMVFAGGRVRLFRVVKMQGTEFLPLNLLLATGDLAAIWQNRVALITEDGVVTVLSPASLARMKALRGSGIDQDDIHKLKGQNDEEA